MVSSRLPVLCSQAIRSGCLSVKRASLIPRLCADPARSATPPSSQHALLRLSQGPQKIRQPLRVSIVQAREVHLPHPPAILLPKAEEPV